MRSSPARSARAGAGVRLADSTRTPASRDAKESTVRTELCKKLGIDLPIFAFTHCRDVVVAVSKAGGFGVLGVVGFSPEQLEVELKWIDERIGDRPYGIDVVIPASTRAWASSIPRSSRRCCRRRSPSSTASS